MQKNVIPHTIEPASINPNHDRQRLGGVYVNAGRSEHVEGKAVLGHIRIRKL
jgi:hypothetical protein